LAASVIKELENVLEATLFMSAKRPPMSIATSAVMSAIVKTVASSSACEAPRRNEKLEATANSK
jgi:hypothetical protein